MLQAIVTYIVEAILSFLVKLGLKTAKEASNKAEDEKKNSDIEKGIEDAKTEKEAQDALNKAAGRLGRNP